MNMLHTASATYVNKHIPQLVVHLAGWAQQTAVDWKTVESISNGQSLMKESASSKVGSSDCGTECSASSPPLERPELIYDDYAKIYPCYLLF